MFSALLVAFTLFVAAIDAHHIVTSERFVYEPSYLAALHHEHDGHTSDHYGGSFPCPAEQVFAPCSCSQVSFDGKKFYSQISCSHLSGQELKSVFHRASHYHNVSRSYDIIELKDTNQLSLCCENMFEEFRFKTIKITDSTLCVIHRDALLTTSPSTKEIVLTDVNFTPNLVDGHQFFSMVKTLPYLTGIFIISSNLQQLPSDAFRAPGFGKFLQVVRICNTQITRIPDFVFLDLPSLTWIDLGDNKIGGRAVINGNTFSLASTSFKPLQISLSGNQLDDTSMVSSAFTGTRRAKVTLHLAHNARLNTLRREVFDGLLRSGTYLIDVDDDPFICDCRHRWLFEHSNENQQYLRNMNCVAPTLGSVWTMNLPAQCDPKPPQLLKIITTNGGGPSYKKCCSRINYDLEREHRRHGKHYHYHVPHREVEVIHVTPAPKKIVKIVQQQQPEVEVVQIRAPVPKVYVRQELHDADVAHYAAPYASYHHAYHQDKKKKK